MRQDWIEFKGKLLSDGQYNFSLRPEYIVAIDGKGLISIKNKLSKIIEKNK